MEESVSALFDTTVERFNKRPAMQYVCPQEAKWKIKNWQELLIDINKLANALNSIEVKAKDRILLLSMTRPEWVICDIAIIKASCIVVPIYHSSLNDQIAYIMSDTDAKIILLENEVQLKKIRQIEDALSSNLKRIIIFDQINGSLKENEIYLADFVRGQSDNFTSLPTKSNEIASLVYTSGTTGEPKGAMISHDNLIYEAQVIDKLGILSSEDVQLIFLPLAHIFARVLVLAWIRTGHLLAFAQSIEKVVDDMAIIKPTFMAGVPRIFEKIMAKTIETALSMGGIKKIIAQFAFKEADRLSNDPKSSGLKTLLAKKLVFKKIGKALNEKFGGRLRFFISGGAQLSPEVFTFFELLEIMICEGYGLTETTAATCLNLPWSFRYNSVGRPLPGTNVKLGDDQEILVQGRGVFLGFWQKPEQTKEVLDQDGWFHTGDIGKIDGDGFVKIIDRKRDIIVTSQGKNIAPQRVESLVKSKSPIIAHVVVVGDKRPYLTALIALDFINAKKFIGSKEKNQSDMLEISADTSIYQEVKRAVLLANASLASFEQIKRFQILDKEFEVGKQLTPTFKVKRKACIEEFIKEIRMLYA
jgi:long-chain acyl-CoA synthetase